MRAPYVLAALACGCSAGNVAVDAGSDTPGERLGSYTYVIGAFRNDAGDPSMFAFGFDLDRGATPMPGSCTDAPDFVDPYDPTNTQVDNQAYFFLSQVGTTLDVDPVGDMLRDEVARGEVLVIIAVSDVNSFVCDPSVRVHVMLGAAVAANACAAHGNGGDCTSDTANRCTWIDSSACTAVVPSAACAAHMDRASCEADVLGACSASFFGCRGVARGQTFVSVTDLGTVWGAITSGRLVFSIDRLPLGSVLVPSGVAPFVLHDAHLAARITETTLSRGELGGTLNVTDVVMPGGIHCPSATCTTAELARSAGADQQPVPNTTATCSMHSDAASCTADTGHWCSWRTTTCVGVTAGSFCLGISAGLGFEAVAATSI